MPFSIQTLPPDRQPFVVERGREERRVGRIGVERHALVGHLLAHARAAARLRERASSFVGRARVERAAEERHEVVDRLRLEHRRVHPGLDRLRVAALDGLAARPMRPIAAASIAPQSREPVLAQPLPVPSGVRAVTERSASVVRWYANRPRLVADGDRPGVDVEESGDEDAARGLARRERGIHDAA